MSTVEQLARGAAAGFAATAPMTAVMEALHRRLPPQERYPLPPSQITAVVETAAGVADDLSDAQHRDLTLAGHFAYGAAAGALYPLVARRLPLPPALRGMAYAMGVWTASYLGWLPALGVLRPATEHPPARTALMVAAHLVWGAALGLAAR